MGWPALIDSPVMATPPFHNHYFTALFLIVMATCSGSAQSNVALQGVWQATELITADASSITIGKAQLGLYIFTSRHYSMTRAVSTEPRPQLARAALASASAAELRATLLEFIGEAGEYELSGSVLTVHRVSALIPTNVGTTATFSWHIDGNYLTLTQMANATGPATNPATVKFSRVE